MGYHAAPARAWPWKPAHDGDPIRLRQLTRRSNRARVDAERRRRYEPAPPTHEPDRRTRRLFPLGGGADRREWCLGAVRGRAGRRGLAAAAAATRRSGDPWSRLGVRVPRTAGRRRQCNRSSTFPRAPAGCPAASRQRDGRCLPTPVNTVGASHQRRHGRTTAKAHRETSRAGPSGQVRRFTRAPPTRAVGQGFSEGRCDATRSDAASEALDGAARGYTTARAGSTRRRRPRLCRHGRPARPRRPRQDGASPS